MYSTFRRKAKWEFKKNKRSNYLTTLFINIIFILLWVNAIEKVCLFVCLFVCFEFIVQLENVSLIWRRHLCWWGTANFKLCSALMAIEQWGILTCHIYCDTGLLFIMVISEGPGYSTCCPAFGSGAITTFLKI